MLSQEVSPLAKRLTIHSNKYPQEIEEACGNLLGLTAGMRDAADEVPASPPLS